MLCRMNIPRSENAVTAWNVKSIKQVRRLSPDKGMSQESFFDWSRAIFKRKKKAYEGFDTMTLIGPGTNLIKFRESALVKDKPMKRES